MRSEDLYSGMPTRFQLTRLHDILLEEIPISAAMGIEIVPEGDGFVVEAPLGPNRNLQHTFFGGSLSALGLIAGWSWLRLALRDSQLEPDLVIQRSEMDFRLPAAGRTRARPVPPDDETWTRFLRTLRRKRRARIRLGIELESPVPGTGTTLVPDSRFASPVRVAEMSGSFVAIDRG